MAFASFGAPTKSPAPAPSGIGFSFGAKPAPAPATGAFSFGSSAPAPTFGTPAPAPAFGASAPAPSTGGLFGSTSAPAPTMAGLFGSPPAPAFGSSPAPSGGLFGSAAAPASGGIFGGAAPAPSLFGGTSAAPTPAAASTAAISGQTPYASLPPDAKRALDTIHEHIMRHRRAMIQVQTMAPQLLRDGSKKESPSSPADVAAGVGDTDSAPLPVQLTVLQRKIQELKHNLDVCGAEAQSLRNMYETSATQAVIYGKWPVEAIAVREGVKLSASESKADPKVQNDLKALIDQRSASVDRVERVPSPYFWEVLQDLEARLGQLQQSVTSIQSQLQQCRAAWTDGGTSAEDITSVVQLQTQALWRVASAIARIHEQMEQVRVHYRQCETGENVLDKADAQDLERQRRIEQQMRIQYVKAAQGQTQPSGPSPAPASTGLFGSTPAPATGGVFGSTPATAPSTGGLFGSTPAPAPTAFGATPAPAPGGGLFGTAPAPAAGGAFGSSAAPAPGGLFVSTAPTPASGPFTFGGSSSVSTPKSKSKSRSGRSRR